MTTEDQVEFLSGQIAALDYELNEAKAELKRHHDTFQRAGECANRLDFLVNTLQEENGDLVQCIAQLRTVLQVTHG